MFKHLVVMHKMISIEYFMDKLQEWEAAELYRVISYSDYAIWESTRILLSPHIDRKKVRNVKDIMKFPWDRDASRGNTEMSNADKERVKHMAEAYAKLLK